MRYGTSKPRMLCPSITSGSSLATMSLRRLSSSASVDSCTSTVSNESCRFAIKLHSPEILEFHCLEHGEASSNLELAGERKWPNDRVWRVSGSLCRAVIGGARRKGDEIPKWMISAKWDDVRVRFVVVGLWCAGNNPWRVRAAFRDGVTVFVTTIDRNFMRSRWLDGDDLWRIVESIEQEAGVRGHERRFRIELLVELFFGKVVHGVHRSCNCLAVGLKHTTRSPGRLPARF